MVAFTCLNSLSSFKQLQGCLNSELPNPWEVLEIFRPPQESGNGTEAVHLIRAEPKTGRRLASKNLVFSAMSCTHIAEAACGKSFAGLALLERQRPHPKQGSEPRSKAKNPGSQESRVSIPPSMGPSGIAHAQARLWRACAGQECIRSESTWPALAFLWWATAACQWFSSRRVCSSLGAFVFLHRLRLNFPAALREALTRLRQRRDQYG